MSEGMGSRLAFALMPVFSMAVIGVWTVSLMANEVEQEAKALEQYNNETKALPVLSGENTDIGRAVCENSNKSNLGVIRIKHDNREWQFDCSATPK